MARRVVLILIAPPGPSPRREAVKRSTEKEKCLWHTGPLTALLRCLAWVREKWR